MRACHVPFRYDCPGSEAASSRSQHPQPSVPALLAAAVGEYLMMLPQQLEGALLGGGGGGDEGGAEEAGQLVADWLDRVRCGAGGGGGRAALRVVPCTAGPEASSAGLARKQPSTPPCRPPHTACQVALDAAAAYLAALQRLPGLTPQVRAPASAAACACAAGGLACTSRSCTAACCLCHALPRAA